MAAVVRREPKGTPRGGEFARNPGGRHAGASDLVPYGPHEVEPLRAGGVDTPMPPRRPPRGGRRMPPFVNVFINVVVPPPKTRGPIIPDPPRHDGMGERIPDPPEPPAGPYDMAAEPPTPTPAPHAARRAKPARHAEARGGSGAPAPRRRHGGLKRVARAVLTAVTVIASAFARLWQRIWLGGPR